MEIKEIIKGIQRDLKAEVRRTVLKASPLAESEITADVTGWISTGSTLLDLAIKDGIPLGRLTEIIGEEASGKTTILTSILKQTQLAGGVAILFDSEAAFDSERAKELGINVDELIYFQPDTLEEFFETTIKIIKSIRAAHTTIPVVIGLDSVAGISTKAELEGEFSLDGASWALHAKLLAKGFRKIIRYLSKEKIALVVTNQLKEKMSATHYFQRQLDSYGGKAIKYHSSVRILLEKISPIKISEDIKGNIIHIKIKKNKVGKPFKRVDIPLFFDRGIEDGESLIDFLLKKGIIISTKKKLIFGDQEYSRSSLLQLLKNDASFREILKEELRKVI